MVEPSEEPSDRDQETESEYTESSSSSEQRIAQRETVAVFRQRILVIFALVVAACVVSITSFRLTTRSEEQAFENEFESLASKLLLAFEQIATQKIAAIEAMSTITTSYVQSVNATWPFVVLPDFHYRAEAAISLSQTLSLILFPIVNDEDREEWSKFVVDNVGWIEEGRMRQREIGTDSLAFPDSGNRLIQETEVGSNSTVEPAVTFTDDGVATDIHHFRFPEGAPYFRAVDPGPGPYLPAWQTEPVIAATYKTVNLNHMHLFELGEAARECIRTQETIIGVLDYGPPGGITYRHPKTSYFASIISMSKGKKTDYGGDPFSIVQVPVFDSMDKATRKHVAIFASFVQWKDYFENLLSEDFAISLVLENDCGGQATYEVRGPTSEFVGHGDHHDSKFTYLEKTESLEELLAKEELQKERIRINQEWCSYSVKVYPTQQMADQMLTSWPLYMALGVIGIFVFTVLMFVIYDRLVELRQRLVLNTAEKSTAIVSSLFPKKIQERLMAEQGSSSGFKKGVFSSEKDRVKSFLSGGSIDDEDELDTKPIADLFPHATVLFADMTGFTSWASTREPGHVFILLQTVYQAFDVIAKRFKVFKVETIGDSYVACTGIPNPVPRHAVLMSRFAFQCMKKLTVLTKKLEPLLGPDTSDLGMRFGIHSGPVTAGVLRGERARFQLFGDTVNVAARMESTGARNRIQVSHATASLLREAGKGQWVSARSDVVEAKGKGALQTYWVVPQGVDTETSVSCCSQGCESLNDTRDEKANRLIEWMIRILLTHLKNIVAHRAAVGASCNAESDLVYVPEDGKTCLDEVEECIRMPKFDSNLEKITEGQAGDVEISETVVAQLTEFVSGLSSMYKNNPFHNFEHAAHVTMCVDKFLKRIVLPDIEVKDAVASHLHDHTYGITSDPTTCLAIVLSAVIHDCDHRGVSNVQLAKEEEQMAELYHNKSIAEQNSLDLAWNLLMQPQFRDLRACMFGNRTGMMRFRQVLVNVVLATDIFDKELNDLRKKRWGIAFDERKTGDEHFDFRATIVIEHIIQASDVSHTMQHWHVYRKWNKRLLTEMYVAYKASRMGKDPFTFWYDAELGFFDNYVIPLAKKLKDCNVFGVSSDECLNYACQNRAEWKERGLSILNELKEDLDILEGEKDGGEMTEVEY